MTYLFKLARRTARMGALPLITIAAVLAGCDTDRLTNSSEDPAAVPATEPGPPPVAFAVGFRGGIPFGWSALPTSYFGDVYNGALRNISPDALLDELAGIKARGGRTILMMAGHERNYKDGSGHFSLSMWKDRIDRFRNVNLSSYIEDGTLAGHYMIDEPNDPVNWGDPIPGSMLEAMAAYSKQIWPKLPTIVRVEPDYLAEWNVTYRSLDASWASWLTRKGDPSDYVRVQVAYAKQLGLGLVVGLNVSKGGPDRTPLSASMIQSAGSALLANDYPCAFINWEWDDYSTRSDVRTAMANLSDKAQAHAARSCGTSTLSLGSTTGIALKAAVVMVDGRQIVNLTWSGAAGSSVDVYINGDYRRTTVNDGVGKAYPQRAGQYSYRICVAGKTTCSNSATVTIK